MTPGKNTVKSNPHFCASASSGTTPKNGMAASSIVTGSPKSAMRYQWIPTRHRSIRPSRSRTPSLPPVAAVTRKAGTASPRTVTSVWTTVSGSSIGRTPNPFSERRMGIRLPHPNPKTITTKAVAGWPATRRLSVEWVVGWWSLVVVDTICILFSFDGSRIAVRRHTRTAIRRCWLLDARLGPYAYRLGGGSAQDARGHPRPAYRQHHRACGHRRRGGLGADRQRVRQTEDVHQNGCGRPQRSGPLGQDPGAPDRHPQEHVAHEREHDRHKHG